MPSPFLQCRVDRDTRERAEVAAEQCGMAIGTWLRAIVDSALELHFGIDVPSASRPGVVYHVDGTGCTCPGYANHGHCRHLALLHGEDMADPTPAEQAAEAAAYARQVDEDAVALRPLERVTMPPPPPRPAPPKVSPRDCVHPPQRRNGGRCGVCGVTVGASARIPAMRGARR